MSDRRTYRTIAVTLAIVWGAAAPAPAAAAGAATTRTKPFKRPPYYHGSAPAPGATVVHMGPVVAAAPETPEAWIPGKALQRFAAEIDRFVADQALSSGSVSAVEPVRGVQPPTVYFGCALDAIGECDASERQNVLATTGGTRPWRERIVEARSVAGADYVMLLELRVAPQWIHQKNLSGKKEVRLGTDHVQRLAWLTSLDSPVWVLQITGAVVDGEGKVVRSGAEGLWAVRTPFRVSALSAERMLSDEEVEFVRTGLLRDDLPGRPLGWQAAVRRLVHELLTPGER